MATSSAKNTSNQYVKYKITITQNSRDIANNKSNVTVSVKFYRTNTGYSTYGTGTVYCKIDGTQYSAAVEHTQKITENGIVLFSKTLDIPHNADGKKTLTCSAWISLNTPLTSSEQSYSQVLTAIPRQATLTAAPNFNDEENPTITYSNLAGNAVDKLEACIANAAGTVVYAEYRDIPKTGTSYQFVLTDAEREALQNATLEIGKTTMTVRFYVTTTIGGVIYYSTLDKTLTIINATPELTVSAKDTGGYSTPLTGNENKIIKGFNYVNVSMSSVLKKGATIKSQSITNGSQKINGSSGGFNNTENNTFIFSLTDTRGNTVTKNITLEMVDYIKLTCNLETKNPTADGKMTFKISGNYFKGNFGAVDNTLAVEFRYKENDGDYSEWITAEPIPTINGNTYETTINLTGLNYRSSYTFQARAIDKTNTILSSEKKVKTIPVFDWGENDFNVNGDLKINDIPMTDFVVEQGVSGIWYYRKWNSGAAECWATSLDNNINASQNNMNGFYYSDAISKDLPFTFKTVNYYSVTGGSMSNMNIVRPAGYSNTNITYWVISAVNSLTNVSVRANLEVKGTWK